MAFVAAGPTWAQQIDMAAVQRWSNVTVVKYQIVGEFDGWTEVSDWASRQDRESGEVQAIDTLTLSFDWNSRQGKLNGPVKIENAKTSVKGTRNTVDARIAPVLTGAYEHLEATSVSVDSGGAMSIKGKRRYPEAKLALDYPGSMAMKPVQAEEREVVELLAVPDPGMMAMAGLMPSQTTSTGVQMTFTPDKKSFVMKMDGWTWTYTPTIIE